MDTDEAVAAADRDASPREQEVLSLRFGLGGRERLSLSQVGKVLDVSKERVRQIQDRALQKLRDLAEQENLANRLACESLSGRPPGVELVVLRRSRS